MSYYVKIFDDESSTYSFYRAGVSLPALQYVVGANGAEDYLVFHGAFRGNAVVAEVLIDVGFRFDDVNEDAWFPTKGEAEESQAFAYARKINEVNTAQALLNFRDKKENEDAVSLLRDNITELLEKVEEAKEAE